MTREQRTHILRGLKKNSPVKYIGKALQGTHTARELTPGMICHKVRNSKATCRGDRSGQMVVIAHGKGHVFWYVAFKNLTCHAIEVMERLESSTKNAQQ